MRAITALSIASDAIRAAVIADPYTDSPTIKHFQALPLPVGAVVDGEVVDAEVVTGLLKTLVQRFKFPRENTILVYSSRRMVFREADFPYMSLADLRSTLPFQAKGMIPLPIEESELDFVPLSVVDDEQNGKQLHGILVATLRGGLEKTAYTRRRSGFRDHLHRRRSVRVGPPVQRHQPGADRSGGQHQRQLHRRDRAQ